MDTRIPWMLLQSTLSRLAREKGHQVRAMGVSSAVVHIFNEIAMHAWAQASNRMAKANRASHGPRVSPHTQAKVRVRKTRENPKENPKEPKMRTKELKAYTSAKHRKRFSQVLKNSRIGNKFRTLRNLHTTYTPDTSWNDGWER